MWPTTIVVVFGDRSVARPRTYSIMGRPATRCSTFGPEERMRTPFPAARMTTWRSVIGTVQFTVFGFWPENGFGVLEGRKTAAIVDAGWDAGVRLLRGAALPERRGYWSPREGRRDPRRGGPLRGFRRSARSPAAGVRLPLRSRRAGREPTQAYRTRNHGPASRVWPSGGDRAP